MWDMIVTIPDHCLSFTLSENLYENKFKVNYNE